MVRQVALEGAVSKKSAMNSLAHGVQPQVMPCHNLLENLHHFAKASETSEYGAMVAQGV